MKIKSLSLPSARKKDLEPNSKAPLGKSKVSKYVSIASVMWKWPIQG